MANQWFRLWHDMVTDPKFGTVARVSGEHITLVLSVALHLMTDASRNVTRGHVTVTGEDLATALNVTDEQIDRVLAAMEGRLINDGYLSGWEKRQPKREDFGDEQTGAKSAAQRKKEQRDREKAAREAEAANASITRSHDESRNVTLDKEEDKDKEKSSNTHTPLESVTPIACVTEPGKVCKAMKSAGIGDVNPGHPDLLMLLNAGATVAEFEGAATTAAKKGKGFAYALGTLKRTRQDAANTAQTLHTGPLPSVLANQPMSFAERDRLAGIEKWEKLTGRIHPDRPQTANPVQHMGDVIETTAHVLEIAK